MNKKTIAGVIIFTIALGIFIGYPNIQEYRYKKNIEAMIGNQEFQRVYDRLMEEEVSEYDWKFVALMIAEFELGHSIYSKVQELIYYKEIGLLQSLVDKLGVRLGHWLGPTLLSVEGLVFDSEFRYYLATQEVLGIAPHNVSEYGKALESAMEFRHDTDPVDHIYIRYLLHKGDFEKALELYSEIPEELLPDVHWIFGLYFLDGMIYDWEKGYNVTTGGLHLYERDQIKRNLSSLDNLDIPEGVMNHVMRVATSYSRSTHYEEVIDMIEETPFFADNMYYQFYNLTYQLASNDKSKAEVAFGEIKEKTEFQKVKGYQDIVKIYGEFEKVTKINKISNAGFIHFTVVNNGKSINKLYDIYGGREQAETLQQQVKFLQDSPGRNNILAEILNQSGNNTELAIFNNRFELVHRFDPLERIYRNPWIDEENLVISSITIISSSFPAPDKIFNIKSKEMSDVEGEVTSPTIEHNGNFEVYSINEDTYTSFDYFEVMGEARYREYTHYTIRDIDTHEVLYKFDLQQIPGGLSYFIGSCSKYIYYQEVVGPFIVVGAIDKETHTKSRLPLYTTEFNYELFRMYN